MARMLAGQIGSTGLCTIAHR